MTAPVVVSNCADCGTVTAGTAMIRIAAIVLLALSAAPVNAQEGARIFHDAQGRVTGSARTDANGVTTLHDAFGRTTGTARTDANGTTTFHDAFGRTTGTARTDTNGVTTFRDAFGRTTGSIRSAR